ncbi:hypothetical protein Tco_1497749, partial [Tanacetum coccineum]
LDLEKEKDAQVVEILKLKKRSSSDDLDEDDASKQGRTSDKTKPMFKDSDFDDLDDLVDEGMTFVQEKDAENQGKIGADDTEVVTQKQLILLSLIKMKEEKAKEKGVAIKDIERDAEEALRLQAELDKELKVERERQKEAFMVAIVEITDEVQARIDVDYELAARMTQEEQEKYTIKERARIQDFTPIDSEKEAQKPDKRLKRVAGSYVTQKSPKKPKVMKSAKDVTDEEATEYEKEKEELRLSLKIISNDDSELLGKMEEKDMYVYKLTKADESSSYHGDTKAFLRRLDKQDLNDLYRMIFDPDEKDEYMDESTGLEIVEMEIV